MDNIEVNFPETIENYFINDTSVHRMRTLVSNLSSINFIVGENNVGKSSLINLIHETNSLKYGLKNHLKTERVMRFKDSIKEFKCIYNLINYINFHSMDELDVILIDDIEQGIHHKMIFEVISDIVYVISKYDIKIFATTHSYEWIKRTYQYITSDWYILKQRILEYNGHEPKDIKMKVIRMERPKPGEETNKFDNIRLIEYSHEDIGISLNMGWEMR